MYAAVPRMIPAFEAMPINVGEFDKTGDACSCSIAFANPKSRTFTLPSEVIFTFAGFKSRWTIPRS